MRDAEAGGRSAAPIDGSLAGEAAQLQEGAAQRLAAAVAEVAGAEAVEQLAVRGHAAEVLVAQSRDAELLVVGSRGHGTITGAVLGSVSHACTHHASCPVVVREAATSGRPAGPAADVIARELGQNAETWGGARAARRAGRNRARARVRLRERRQRRHRTRRGPARGRPATGSRSRRRG